METTWARSSDIPETRLRLLRALYESLSLAQAHLVALDLENFERQTGCQQQMCRELRAWPAAAAPPLGAGQRQELRELQAQLSQQCRVHSAFLRRSRRTIDIFCRVLASSGVTYARPAPPRSRI